MAILQKFLNINPRSCFELGFLAKTVDTNAWRQHDESAHFHTLVNLQLLSEVYLSRKIDKPNWSAIYSLRDRTVEETGGKRR